MLYQDDLIIVEESSKDGNKKPCSLFYIRERNHKQGYTYQSTSSTLDGANWTILRFSKKNIK